MKLFFTADQHFGHKNIIEYCARPFITVEEMNSTLVSAWNKVVTNEDTVYCLGDLFFKANRGLITYVMSKLNGNIVLIKGNHDGELLKWINRTNFDIQKHDYLEIKLDGKLAVLSHYPFLTWNQKEKGSIQLHGHCHEKIVSEHPHQINVGVDSTDNLFLIEDKDYIPWAPFSEDQIIRIIKRRELNAIIKSSAERVVP